MTARRAAQRRGRPPQQRIARRATGGSLFGALVSLSLLGAAPARAAIEEQPAPKPTEAPAPPPAPVLTRAPELLEFSSATYPPALLEAGVGGDVLLFIDIDAAGEVERVELVSSSEPDFGAPAMSAATRFRFSPAEIDGKPAGIRIEYRYLFTPELPQPDAIAGETPTRGDEAPVTFSGVVLEAGLRTPLANAVISIGGRPAAETNDAGEFAVRGVPPGRFHVTVSAPHHRAYEVDEELAEGEALRAKYYLVRESSDPYETIVRTRQPRHEVAKVELERREVEKVPGTFGDPVRVIENMPGMARTPGGLGGALLVRGANPQDSRVFIDGIEIPLLYHFGGLESVVNASFLENIEFFPGGFGARYGGATAGIVDVQSRDIDCELWRGNASVSILGVHAYSCYRAGEVDVAAAGRRSYFDAFLPTLLDSVPREPDEGVVTLSPVYADYQAKAQSRAGDHALSLFAFGSDDQFELVQSGSTEDVNFDFGMHLAFHRVVLRDRWKISNRAALLSSLSPGYQLSELSRTSDELDSSLGFGVRAWGVQWREELSIELADWLKLKSGIDWAMGRARLDMSFPFPTDLRNPFPAPTYDYSESRPFAIDLSQTNHAYYVEALLEGPWRTKLVPGLRVDRWDFHKTQDFSIQPRITGRWEIREGMAVKAAWGIYEKLPEPQFLVDRPLGNPKLEPLRSQHFIVGYEHALSDLISADVQLFYNLRYNDPSPSLSVRYKDGKAIPEVWASDGLGRTYGAELLLRHLATPNGWFYGWLSYTLSRSVRQDRRPDATYTMQQGGDFNELAYDERDSQEYLAPFDQPHILTLVAQFVLPRGFEAGMRYRLVSGNPYTPLEKGRVFYDADSDRYRLDMTGVPRNSKRMPTFHQLDLRVDKTFTFDLWKLTAYLELINAYNAKNVEQYSYDYRYREKAPLTFLPIVPILGVKGEF